MTSLALVFSLFIVAVGALGVADPARLVDFVRRLQTPGGLAAVGLFRVVFGVALFLGAEATRAPDVLRVLGVAVVVAGVATPFFGIERYRRLLDWWASRGQAFVRVWAAVAMGFGLLLAWALLP